MKLGIKNLKPLEEHLDNIQNLSVIGRYGSFKYNNQDHSILMGILQKIFPKEKIIIYGKLILTTSTKNPLE